VKAIELTSETPSAVRLNKVKRDRLLMLPRMQRDNPPTHLIHSRNGDFLRGRVIGMNDKVLRIEARLETKEIPRDRIAQIIWLHPDELDEGGAADKDRDGANRAREREPEVATPAEQRIARSLDKPTTVEFLDLPLEDALTFLKEYHNIRLTIDRENLADQRVALEQPVTLKLEKVAFRTVLKDLLEPLQLAWVIEADALKIITAADAAANSKAPGQRFPVPAPLVAAGHTRVQALRSDGSRLTFFASQMSDATLAGTSEVLGACRVNLKQIDQLLIGTAIEQAAAQLAYQQWKLHNAPDPKFALADGADGDVDTGTDSVLVGKPAPDFELQLLTGKKFQLAQNRGRVVVLDFWATWCGPCLTAMPLVDRIVHEFDGAGVQLIAVNQQETPKQITSMLERHKLNLTVALDRDGGVSQKYRAESIPQTVIIDRTGNVARVFVGIGPNSAETLREALRSVLAPPGDPAKPSP
jgi:peroxiredoxin